MNANEKHFLHRTEGWAKEEIGAQGGRLGILDDQREAIVKGNATALDETGKRLERELSGGGDRERRRKECLSAFARTWNVASQGLTLVSICERIGVEAERLLALREELRRTVAQVIKRGRQIAAIARYHRGLMDDVMQILLGDVSAEGDRRGALVDAEA